MILSVVIPTAATDAGTVGDRKLGLVVDIIDGEAMVVKFGDANVFIKLIGINTKASEDALDYMTTHVKGKYVWVVTEDLTGTDVQDTKYYSAYVYMQDTGEMVNQILLKEGLANLKTSNLVASKYSELNSALSQAKSKKVGIWSTNKTSSSKKSSKSSNSKYSYSGDCININTASSSQLTDLDGITSTIASNIINYRKQNPFNTVEEIKFVKGMTKDIYDDIYDEITVVTNINEATEKELLTLNGLSQSEVDSIIDYREDEGDFTSLEQFYQKTNLTSSDYNNNKNFISLEDEESIDYTINDSVVNINTASESQIKSAVGSVLSSSEVSYIISNRRNGYTYKTLMELCKLPRNSITEQDVNYIEDNLHVTTDINNATTDELRSLFGSSYSSSDINEIKSKRPFDDIDEIEDIVGSSKFKQIKDFIYVDEYEVPDRTNINLADRSQLEDLSLTSSEVSKLEDKAKDINSAIDLPFNVSDIDNSISLYTNINTASESELETLYDISSSTVSAIVSYREDQPFGSKDEIKQFFEDEDEMSVYRYIANYIVVR